MASLRTLKRRIHTIKNTAQVTKAMQMISLAKMKNAEQLARQAVPYSQGLVTIMEEIGTVTGYAHPLLAKHKQVQNIGVILVGPEKGFVGGMQTSLFSTLKNHIGEIKQKYPNANYIGIAINKRAQAILEAAGIPVEYAFTQFANKSAGVDISALMLTITSGYIDLKLDLVYLCYSHFKNTLVQIPTWSQLLPFVFDKQALPEEAKSIKLDSEILVFEPSKSQILNFLIPEYLESQILAAIFDANAAEEAARMVSMKNATDNAQQLGKDLQLEYNRTRQAKITNELLEIAQGASAIN